MEWFILGGFALSLFLCIVTGLSILIALTLGLVLFTTYAHHRGFSAGEIKDLVLLGIKPVRTILFTFLFIGVLTSLWRAGGTIPVLVSLSTRLITPRLFLPMAFALNALISFLTGTSFGTASTMGVICATMGGALGVSPILTGGAVLSGAFFGDRCSPVSTSALLVATLTDTVVYENIPPMMRSARVPLILTVILYALTGFFIRQEGPAWEAGELFSSMNLSPASLIPALVILVLAAGKVNIRLAMAGSILSSIPCCLLLQGMTPLEVLCAGFWGYHPQDPALSRLLSGGGITSMIRVACIVCLSSSYSKLLQETGLLSGIEKAIGSFAKKAGTFTATLVTSVLTGILSCNQTLTILLTRELCQAQNPDKKSFALDLEDTAVVIAPLIPWSIAGAVPLSVIGAPKASLLAAFYLFLIPLWRWGVSRNNLLEEKKP